MRVTVELPPDVAEQLQHEWGDLSRHILETIAVEGYRSGQLSALQVRNMLGYETPMEFDALLQRAGVWRSYTEQELRQDYEASRQASEPQQHSS
jgi:hypothetical protein